MRARSNRCRASTTTLVPREASRVAVVDGWHLIVVEHICVDVNPEPVETGTGHDTGGLDQHTIQDRLLWTVSSRIVVMGVSSMLMPAQVSVPSPCTR